MLSHSLPLDEACATLFYIAPPRALKQSHATLRMPRQSPMRLKAASTLYGTGEAQQHEPRRFTSHSTNTRFLELHKVSSWPAHTLLGCRISTRQGPERRSCPEASGNLSQHPSAAVAMRSTSIVYKSSPSYCLQTSLPHSQPSQQRILRHHLLTPSTLTHP